jgi:hypothetical protein
MGPIAEFVQIYELVWRIDWYVVEDGLKKMAPSSDEPP